MLKLPVGIESFNDIVKNNYYYVDKTEMIKELLDSGSKVTLFTRPRRFGKSLNMDMLKSFFEIGTDISLFNGLKISNYKELCNEYQGQFPVISISLKDVKGLSFEDAVSRLNVIIKEEAKRHRELLYSERLDSFDREELNNIITDNFKTTGDLCFSLKLLTRLVYEHYGKRAVVLIDEYDVPLDKAYQNGYYAKMSDITSSLFSAVLKSNDYLNFAVITGCLRIARESIFTGLNNFNVRTISDNAFSFYFGFTGNEVDKILKYYGMEDKFSLFKEWYDGYRFGDTEIYCPWDVINQCSRLYEYKNAEMESHWINSSSNYIIKDIIKDATTAVRGQIEALISGESIVQTIIPELTYADLYNSSNKVKQKYLWSVLYATGYLTDAKAPVNKKHVLVIPNREILEIYKVQVLEWAAEMARCSAWWIQFCHAIGNGDAKEAGKLLGIFLSNSASIRDTCQRDDMKENFYHGMLLALLELNDNWIVTSERESGNGYADIIVETGDLKTGFIFEIKYAKDGNLKNACEIALQQIKDRDYTSVLVKEDVEVIYQYGAAFYKKTCMLICRKL